MGKQCKVCNVKLGMFYRKNICKNCLDEVYGKFLTKNSLLSLPKLDKEKLDELKKFGKEKIIMLYDKLLEEYTSDNIMTKEEITNLEILSKSFELTQQESKYNTVIYFHELKNDIEKNKKLPKLNYTKFKEDKIKIQNDEEFYSYGISSLYEMKAHSKYVSGSRGVNVFGFKVGRVQGKRVSELLPSQKSTGKFVITNKRFYYVSDSYAEMTKIDFKKIMSYDSDPEFIILNTHTRQKPYLFKMHISDIKTTLLGLDFLLLNK